MSVQTQEKLNDMHGVLANMLELREPTTLSQLISQIQAGKYKYLLCIDMGCGGTSATIGIISNLVIHQNLRWDETIKGVTSYRQYLPTIIGYNDDGMPVLGERAFAYGRAAQNFKTLPNQDAMDEDNIVLVRKPRGKPSIPLSLKTVWSDYFGEIIPHYMDRARNDLLDDSITNENTIFVIAHPASERWVATTVLDNYRALISAKNGLKSEQIITISEAKAVLQYVFYNKERKMQYGSLNFQKGVIFIDLGASTIDISYISEKSPIANKEFSIELAGREVDLVLANYLLDRWIHSGLLKKDKNDVKVSHKENKSENLFFQRNFSTLGQNKSQFLYWCRMYKESLCYEKGEILRKKCGKCSAEMQASEFEDLLRTISIQHAITDAGFAAYLNKRQNKFNHSSVFVRTWYEFFEDFLRYAIQSYQDENAEIAGVVVTGGTSNLVGVDKSVIKICKEIGISEKNIVILNDTFEYNCTVPDGSFYYVGTALQKMQIVLDFPEKLRTQFQKELTDKLSEGISELIQRKYKDSVQKALNTWASAQIYNWNATKSRLDSLISSEIDRGISQNEIDNIIKHQLSSISRNVNANMPETRKAISEFLRELSGQEKDIPFQLSGVQINVSSSLLRQNLVNRLHGISIWGYAGWLTKIARAAELGGRLFVDKVTEFIDDVFDTNIGTNYFTYDEDLPWKQNVRERLRDELFTREGANISRTVHDELVKAVTVAVNDCCNQNVNNILGDLEAVVNSALYLKSDS